MALKATITGPLKPLVSVVKISAAVHAFVGQSERGQMANVLAAMFANSMLHAACCR